MARIKGWRKSLELPYRIDYENTIKGFNLGLGKIGLIISAEQDKKKSYEKDYKDRLTGRWEVIYRKYIEKPAGQTYKKMRIFKTKKQALDYAIKYMRANPNG